MCGFTLFLSYAALFGVIWLVLEGRKTRAETIERAKRNALQFRCHDHRISVSEKKVKELQKFIDQGGL